MRSTHTVATLGLPADIVHKIRDLLLAAGYSHAVHEEGAELLVDMTGIGLVVDYGMPSGPEARERAFRQALADYPGRNTHQMQARKVCAGVLKLAEATIDGSA